MNTKKASCHSHALWGIWPENSISLNGTTNQESPLTVQPISETNPQTCTNTSAAPRDPGTNKTPQLLQCKYWCFHMFSDIYKLMARMYILCSSQSLQHFASLKTTLSAHTTLTILCVWWGSNSHDEFGGASWKGWGYPSNRQVERTICPSNRQVEIAK